MSSWNYRVMFENGQFRVVEALYNDAGQIYGTAEAAPIGRKWDSPVELELELNALRAAASRPIITPAHVVGAPPWEDDDLMVGDESCTE